MNKEDYKDYIRQRCGCVDCEFSDQDIEMMMNLDEELLEVKLFLIF